MTGNVLIAGAGIGGLTAALALHARGIDVTVIERTDLRSLGVGINLLPHAVRALSDLGLGEELAEIAVAPAAIAYYDTDGMLLFREPRGLEGGYGYPQYSLHRGRLQSLLLSTTRNRLGVMAIRDNTELSDFEDSDAVVQVHTSAGNFIAAVLVGADGIHSIVRRRLHPGPDRLLQSGRRMLRGVVEADAFLDGRTMSIIKSGNGIEFVVYPIGDGQLNWVVMLPEAWPADRAEVLEHLEKWHLDWLDAADLVRRSDPVLE
ncbi:MAG: FAD-dependent monooxygenase, partial [Mycobacterium sp.]